MEHSLYLLNKICSYYYHSHSTGKETDLKPYQQ